MPITKETELSDRKKESRIKKMSPQFLVTDLKRSIKFYQEKLGFELEFCYEDFYAGLLKDGYSIHLKLGKPATEQLQAKRENTDVDLVFSVTDIDALYELFVEKEIEITQPLSQRTYGKEFYIADPDGYIFAYLEEAQTL